MFSMLGMDACVLEHNIIPTVGVCGYVLLATFLLVWVGLVTFGEKET